jgi:4-oxalocrotonate tautomerase
MKGVKMPYISIETFEGKTAEQKKKLIREVTKAVTSTLAVPPESVWIVIKDVPRCNWGEKGQPIP